MVMSLTPEAAGQWLAERTAEVFQEKGKDAAVAWLKETAFSMLTEAMQPSPIAWDVEFAGPSNAD